MLENISPALGERLAKQLAFVLELDKMKNVYRQTYVLGEDRKENDAEHSWHLAVMAFLLAEYSDKPVDVLKVMKMVLVHDVVEIDAGDTYAYDSDGYKTKADREEKAAGRIFGLLPDDQREEFYGLWREFEEGSSDEAAFAAVLDRVQPMLLNYSKDGIAWKEHGVLADQVEKRFSRVADSSAELAKVAAAVISDAESRGLLKKRP